ncbi:MAG: PAS domain-containing protein [Actinomycetota bacterium]
MKDAVSVYASLLRGELAGDEALRATQQMLELVMDSIPQAIFWKGLDSAYLGCNRVFADLAGLEPGEMIGKTDLDMPWANYGATDFRDWDRQVMDTGTPEFGILEKLHRRDGAVLSIETNKVPLRGFDGEVVGLLGTFEDVTEKRRAEEDLRQSVEELDERVRLRTEELSRANAILRREVDERVRLQAEERQQRAYAEAMRETAAAISSSLDLEDVLEEVLVGAERLLSHDLGAVILFDANQPEIEPELVHYRSRFGYGPSADDRPSAPIDLTVIEQLHAAESGPALLSVGPEAETSGLWPDARSMIVAPMAIGGQLVGFLAAESATPGLFDHSHLERLGTVADQAAAAISNARLFERTAEVAAVDERQRLARDLHDSVSQSLWTASLLAGALAEREFEDAELSAQVDAIRVLTRGAVAEMRTLLLELRPRALEEAPLHELLNQLITGLAGRKDVVIEADLASAEPIPIEVKLGVYRIAQEALNNISRHAGATRVGTTLERHPRRVVLTISDNGCGFDDPESRSDRLGLSIMQERASDLGATLEVASVPDGGTTVRIDVPIRMVG